VFTENQLDKYGVTGKKLVDLGCGTGEIALRFADKGYTVTGVDLSEEMLMVGMDKAVHKQVNIQWIQQNIAELDGFEAVDVFVSYLDVVNYITESDDLQHFFASVFHGLAAGGIFIFDVHHLPFMQTERINQTFVDETEHITYIWECVAENSYGLMSHYLTFFI